MKNKNPIKTIVISALFGLLLITYLIGITDQGHTFIHGLVFENDQVYFHKSAYNRPKTMSADEVSKEFLQKVPSEEQSLIPTGESIISLPVYEPLYSINQQKKMNQKYSILLLKKSDGNFIVYTIQKKQDQ